MMTKPLSRPSGRRASLWWLGLALLLLLTRPVAAQEVLPPVQGPTTGSATVTIQQIRIQVMPEFDDPRVLVIVQGRLDVDESTLPRPVTFLIPRGAQINQMSAMDVATGVTTPVDYEAVPDPDDERWTQVTYSLNSAHFFYEYYYDPLSDDADRQFTYVFSNPQDITDMAVEVQQPLKATNFTLDPEATVARADEIFGFTYHQYPVGTLPAGQEFAVDIRYTKTDPNPSVTREQLAAAMQTGSDSSSATTTTTGTPAGTAATTSPAIPTWVAGLLALIVVAGVIVFVWQRSQNQAYAGPDEDTPARLTNPANSPVMTTPANFCPQCGTPRRGDARFCYSCGTSLVALAAAPRTPVTVAQVQSPPAQGAARFLAPRYLVAAGLIILLTAAVWGATAQGGGTVTSPASAIAPAGSSTGDTLDREKMVAGAQIFVTNCTECHGEQAEGTVDGPPLNSSGQAFTRSDNELLEIIRTGRDEMPAWNDQLSDSEIDAVLYFVKRQWTAEQRQQQATLP